MCVPINDYDITYLNFPKTSKMIRWKTLKIPRGAFTLILAQATYDSGLPVACFVFCVYNHVLLFPHFLFSQTLQPPTKESATSTSLPKHRQSPWPFTVQHNLDFLR